MNRFTLLVYYSYYLWCISGIDGGGLFREFLSETLKTGYDPNRGYFVTSQEGLLYPNPQVHLISEDYMSHYRFLGGLLGKVHVHVRNRCTIVLITVM